MSPVDNPTDDPGTYEAETATPMPSDAPSKGTRPASSYIVLPHEGRAPEPGPVPRPNRGYIDQRSIPLGTRYPGASPDPLQDPQRVQGCVPPLWPGHDPQADNGLSAAWRHLWALTEDGPMPWVIAMVHMSEVEPDLQRKTLDGIIRKAISARHLTKRGGYSHKRKTDTRTIERRETT